MRSCVIREATQLCLEALKRHTGSFNVSRYILEDNQFIWVIVSNSPNEIVESDYPLDSSIGHANSRSASSVFPMLCG